MKKLFLGLVSLFLGIAAQAAEVKVLSGGAVKSPLNDLIPAFERDTGHKVKIEFTPMGPLGQRLAAGEAIDLVVVTEDVLPRMESEGHVVRGAGRPLGKVGIGVAVNERAAPPDISTPEAFKRTLLGVRSIVYIDPKTGTSGKHFAGVLERLGIVAEMKPKTTLLQGGYVVEPVGRGEIELGVHQISEILPVKGIRLVGPLPAELQKWTTYVAVPAPAARESATAQALIAHLTSEAARARFAASGFQQAP